MPGSRETVVMQCCFVFFLFPSFMVIHLISYHTISYHIILYMHACIPTYLHTYLHTYIPRYIPAYLHAYTHTCIRAYTHTCIHAYMHTCIHTYIYTYIHTLIHWYIDLAWYLEMCAIHACKLEHMLIHVPELFWNHPGKAQNNNTYDIYIYTCIIYIQYIMYSTPLLNNMFSISHI